MKRKQQRLAEKPIHLLTFAPDKSEKGGVNPFAPSPLRATISKVFVKLEDMTERFEDWCQYGRSEERAVQPLGQRVSKWLGAPVARHAEQAAEAETGLVPARRWEGSVGDVIFRLRDRAGFVQRALTAQARQLKEWVIEHTRSTQAEVDQLREQVSTQQVQVEADECGGFPRGADHHIPGECVKLQIANLDLHRVRASHLPYGWLRPLTALSLGRELGFPAGWAPSCSRIICSGYFTR